jgi:hypothetical protein
VGFVPLPRPLVLWSCDSVLESSPSLELSSFMGASRCLDDSRLLKLSSGAWENVEPLPVKDTVVAVKVELVLCSLEVLTHRLLRYSESPPTSRDEEESSSSRAVVLVGDNRKSFGTKRLLSWERGLSRIRRTFRA